MLLLGGVSTGVSHLHRILPDYYADAPAKIWNVGSVICDLIIAVYMTYYVGACLLLQA
jgi:hypothetical protein